MIKLPPYILVCLFALLVSTGEGQGKAADAASELRISSQHGKFVAQVAVTGDGKLAFSSADSELKIWNQSSGKVLKTLSAPDWIHRILWMELEQKLLVVTSTKILTLSRATLDWEMERTSNSPKIPRVAYDEAWGQLFLVGTYLERYDTKSLNRERVADAAAGLAQPENGLKIVEQSIVALLPCDYDKLIVASGQPSGFALVNTDFGTVESFLETDNAIHSVAALSEGRFIAILAPGSNSKEYQLAAYDLKTLREIARVPVPGNAANEYSIRLERPSLERKDTIRFRVGSFYFYEARLEGDALSVNSLGSVAIPEGNPFNGTNISDFVALPGTADRYLVAGSEPGTGNGQLVETTLKSEGFTFRKYESPVMRGHWVAANPKRDEFVIYAPGVGSMRVRMAGGRLKIEKLAPAVVQAHYTDDGQTLFARESFPDYRASVQSYLIAGDGSLSGKGQLLGMRPTDQFSVTSSGTDCLVSTSGVKNIRLFTRRSEQDKFSGYLSLGSFDESEYTASSPSCMRSDGQLFAVPTYNSAAKKGHPDHDKVRILDRTGSTIRVIDVASEARGVTFVGPREIGLIAQKNYDVREDWFQVYDIDTSRLVRSFRVGNSWTPSVNQRQNYTRSLSRLAVSQEGKCSIFDVESGELISTLPEAGNVITSLDFFSNDRFLLTLDASGSLHFWDIETGKKTADLAFMADGLGWVLSNDDYYFDASPNAAEQVYFAQGEEVVPLDAFYQRLYTPNLWGLMLAGETFDSDLSQEDLLTAPRVEIVVSGLADEAIADISDADEVNVTVTGTARGSAVSEILLYQNGKLVSTGQRGLTVEDDDAGSAPEDRRQVYRLSLLPGENTFKAVALNAERTESRPALRTIERLGNSGGGLRLHVLAIGVNEYQNPKYNLNFARADASAVREAVETGANGLFSSIDARQLLDSEVSRASIEAAFARVEKEAGPRDVFIFYYAGHGVMSQEAIAEFYLVPPDITQLYGDDQQLAKKGVSATLLREWSSRIPAQKQLFIIDACQSAGALQTIAMRGAAEEKAIARLARSTGTHWLTASGSEQFAAEFAELKHGAFTFAILQALSGAADSGDRQVSVRELDAYLQTRVPELTREYRGSPQYPASYGYGQDFPIGLILER